MHNKLMGMVAAAMVLLALGACGQKSATTPAPETAADPAAADAADARERPAAEQQEKQADAAAAKRRDSYRANLVPLLAGSYAGNCLIARGSDAAHLEAAGARVKEKVEVSPAGLVTGTGMQRDLMHGSDTLVFRRTFEAGKAVSAIAVGGASEPAWTFTLQAGQGDKAQLTGDTGAIECSELASAVSLREKALWPVVAGFFHAGEGSLSCSQGGAARSRLAIKAGPAGIDVGGQRFAFDQGLSAETAGFEQGKHLTYAADYDNGAKLVMALERDGKLAQLIAVGQGGQVFDCQSEAAP